MWNRIIQQYIALYPLKTSAKLIAFTSHSLGANRVKSAEELIQPNNEEYVYSVEFNKDDGGINFVRKKRAPNPTVCAVCQRDISERIRDSKEWRTGLTERHRAIRIL